MSVLTWVLLVAAPLLAGVSYLILKRRGDPGEGTVLRGPCPHCGQRFGYQASQVGRPRTCPRCRRPVALQRGTVKWAPRRK
jgi:hypothetical protein